MKKIAFLLVFMLAVAIIPAVTSAVEYGGIGGRPANPRADNPRTQSIFVYELEPGQEQTDAVRVFNNTEETRTIKVGAVDSALASDGAFSCAQELEDKKDVGSWIQLSSASVTVAPGKSKDVPFTINVPSNVSVGEHGGCITIQDTQSTESTTQNGVVLSFRSAIRVAITIPGEIVKDLNFTQINTSADKDSYIVRPTIENKGNVSLDTNVTVRLISLIGTVADTKEGTYPILPNSSASWSFQLSGPFWGGIYRAEAEAKFDGNVNTQLGESAGNESSNRTISSGYILIAPSPIAAVIEGFVALLLVAAIILGVKKRSHKRHVKHRWQTYVVKSGDTVKTVANAHNIPWKKLASSNKLKAPYDLEVGKKLRVPPSASE